ASSRGSSNSSESSSDSSASSSGSSSPESAEKQYKSDVREYTAAYVKTGGQFDAFRRGLGDIAKKHNITNWEDNTVTYEGIGEGAAVQGLHGRPGRAGCEQARGHAEGLRRQEGVIHGGILPSSRAGGPPPRPRGAGRRGRARSPRRLSLHRGQRGGLERRARRAPAGRRGLPLRASPAGHPRPWGRRRP